MASSSLGTECSIIALIFSITVQLECHWALRRAVMSVQYANLILPESTPATLCPSSEHALPTCPPDLTHMVWPATTFDRFS